jgi:hypothetical protein
MSELEVQPVTEPVAASAGLSQWQRVAYIFSAPSKTFEDIKRGNKSWWLPFLVAVVVTYILFAAITFQVGWAQVAENTIHFSAKTEERMSQAPKEQRDATVKAMQYGMEGFFAASPVFALGIVALCTLALWGTINFAFGGKATFGGVFCVWFYASLPGAIKALLGTIVLYAGAAPESFNLNNFAPTNVGAFLNPADTNPGLYTLATWVDFTTIWTMALIGIGIATVAGVKKSSGYIAIFGWWTLLGLIFTGWAAAFS